MTPRITVIAFVLVLFVSIQCKKDQEPVNPELIALDSALQGRWQLEYVFDPVNSEFNIPGVSQRMVLANNKATIYLRDTTVLVSDTYKLEVKEHMQPGATRNCILYKHTATASPSYDVVSLNGDSLYLYPLNAQDGTTSVYSRQ